MIEEDKLLVKKFLGSRSEKAFRLLYRQYTQPLYKLAVHLAGGDRSAAEDSIQEMWTRAVYHLAGFRWDSSLKTWLTGILINCCREQNRKKNFSAVSIDESGDLLSISNPPEIKMDLQKALNILPHGYREVLVLHDMEGYKHGEIGVLLGISEGTSRSQLFHARRTIKELL